VNYVANSVLFNSFLITTTKPKYLTRILQQFQNFATRPAQNIFTVEQAEKKKKWVYKTNYGRKGESDARKEI